MFKKSLNIALLTLAALLLTLPAFADSQVRIVRLSQVGGDVQADRNTGQGFEKAFLNMPVTQGMKLRTNRDGRAEIEFKTARRCAWCLTRLLCFRSFYCAIQALRPRR